MDIICTCTSCHAKFKVGEQAAGKKARCPKCQTVITVPAAATAPGTAPTAPPPPVSRPAPPVRQPSPVASQPMTPAAPSGFPIAATEPGRTRIERKKKSNMVPIIVGSGAALAVLVIAVGVLMFSGSGSTPDEVAPTKKSPPMGTLVLDWPEAERGDATLFINNRKRDIPATGPVALKVSKGRQELRILRRNFVPVEEVFNFVASDSQTFKPEWKTPIADNDPFRVKPLTDPPSDFPVPEGIEIPGFKGWLQDLTLAKQTAKRENKSILMVIGSSDGSPKTPRLGKALAEVGLPDGKLEERFVPVIVDLPTTQEAADRLFDSQENIRFAFQYLQMEEDFLGQLPLLVLADDEGRPCAIEREWPNGFDRIEETVDQLSAKRRDRDQWMEVMQGSDDAAKSAAISSMMKWVVEEKLLNQYRSEISNWMQLAERLDPMNEEGVLETVVEAELLCRLRPENLLSRVKVAQQLSLLEPWLKERRFKDQDRAARLHLIAWRLSLEISDDEYAAAHRKQVLTYAPSDPELQKSLEALKSFDPDVVGNGTGFVVAEGGYLLTNHHVASGKGHIAVKIPGHDKPVPAELVHATEDPDIALIKAEFPKDFHPQPLEFSSAAPKQRLEVTAFGFPRTDALGADEVLPTDGRIVKLPSKNTLNMLMVDMTIHPGNSGGPLCDAQGHVLGMVTAKTDLEGGDNFAYAVAAQDLKTFLEAHLPAGVVRTQADSDESSLEAEELSKSVLMVLRLR